MGGMQPDVPLLGPSHRQLSRGAGQAAAAPATQSGSPAQGCRGRPGPPASRRPSDSLGVEAPGSHGAACPPAPGAAEQRAGPAAVRSGRCHGGAGPASPPARCGLWRGAHRPPGMCCVCPLGAGPCSRCGALPGLGPLAAPSGGAAVPPPPVSRLALEAFGGFVFLSPPASEGRAEAAAASAVRR